MRLISTFIFLLSIMGNISSQAEAQDPEPEKPITYTLISSEELAPVHSVLRGSLKTLLPEAEEIYLDYKSVQAKKYISELEIKFIPYVIFSDSVVTADTFLHMAKNNMIEKQKGYYTIPEEMLRMAEVRLLERKRVPKRLDVFVISHSPYVQKAEAELIDFIRFNKLDVDVRMRYIVDFNEFGLSSKYGPEEIRENLRQITIQKYHPDKFWDYLLLIQIKKQDAVLKELGISLEDIDAKKDEAMGIIKEDYEECKALGIKYPPAFLWENIYLIPILDGLKNHRPFEKKKTQVAREEEWGLPVPIDFFYSNGCRSCLRIKNDFLPKIKSRYKDKIVIRYRNVSDTDEFKLQLALEKGYGTLNEGSVPEIFLPAQTLVGERAIREGLAAALEQILEQKGAVKAEEEIALEENPILDKFSTFSPAVVALAGLADGINPCAFATMVFFVSFLALNRYRKDQIGYIGGTFIFAVFLSYLALGLGIFQALKKLQIFSFFSQLFYYVIALLALGLGIYHLCDYIRYKRTGQTKGCSLKLYNRLRSIVSNKRGLIVLIVAAFVNGFIIALLESACTGQVYFPTIAFVMKVPHLRMHALLYLVFYNLLFILPLVLIFLLAYKGVTSEKLALFEQKHRGGIKLFYTFLFFGLAILLFLL